jgi:hypothetical protein
MMRKLSSSLIAIALLMTLAAMPVVNAQVGGKQPEGKNTRREASFDAVEFVKRFKIGMSYTEVQEALPKDVEQDILSYIVTDETFMLSVDIPGRGNWNASFKFDTLDTPMRRPERLIEMSCGAALSGRNDSFESIVQKVTVAFGEPIKVELREGKFQQAGWRVEGGSVLMLEYSVEPGDGQVVSVEFTIRKSKRRDSSPFKADA